MADGNVGWMVAAKCGADPRPVPTFADLPRQDKRELVRVAIVSAAAAAYFVTLGMLTRPIPSRTLLGGAALPDAPAPRSALLDAHRARRALVDPAPVRVPAAPLAAARVSYEPAAARTPAGARTRPPARSGRPERGGFFSRFFRKITGGGQPAASKADTP